MAKSIKKVTPKKRGRPATGNDPVTTFRVPDDLKLAIDKWREAQPDKPARSAAIRMLIEMALTPRMRLSLAPRSRMIWAGSLRPMQPHEIEGRRPDPDDKNRERRRRTVWLLVIIAGLLAAITVNLMGRL